MYLILSLLLFLFIYPVPSVGAAGTSLTLSDVLTSTLHTNEQVRMADERLYRSEQDKDKAVSALLPKLTLEGNYTRYPKEVGTIGGGEVILQSKKSYNLQLRLNQPLYEGGKLHSGLRIAQAGIDASKRSRTEIQEDLLFESARIYLEVLKAQESVSVEQRNLDRLSEHLRQAKARFDVGEVTQSVVLRAEAEYAGGEASLTSAENALSNLKEQLRSVAGLPDDFVLERPDFSAMAAGEASTDEESAAQKESAMKNRPDFLRAELEETAAKERVTYTRGDYFPSLSLEGIYFHKGADPESTFFIDESWSLAVRLDYPLFDGWMRRANLEQSRSNLREAVLTRSRLKKEIAVEVKTAILNLKTVDRLLDSRNKQVSYARENFTMVSKQFEHGLVTNIDVLDANTLLSQSERDQTHAAIEKDLALLTLQKTKGTFLRSLGISVP
jgi:outer membrane protein